nr:L4 pVIII [Tawny frogmouth aviadenovirus A]
MNLNLTAATPTEYVWKYNPLSGIPAGAQQNYGATVQWVLTGNSASADAIEEIRRRTLPPAAIARRTALFEARSDQQPYAGPRESNYIAASVRDTGYPRSAYYPIDPSGEQRVQMTGGMTLSGGRTEGKVQLTGGRTEGRIQLTGGAHPNRPGDHYHDVRHRPCRPPRWCGLQNTGNGPAEEAETTPDTFKYFLRTEGPSGLVHVPGTYTRREFMTTFVPSVVSRPFDSQEPGEFPASWSSLYKGRTAYEDVFWDWQ